MIDTTVLIPARNASDAVAKQLPMLSSTLEQLGRRFEIVVVDDCSSPAEAGRLQTLLSEQRFLRILRLDGHYGIGAAISAGLNAARGREILTVPAGAKYSKAEIARVLRGLARADLVHARPRVHGLAKTWRRIRRIPRWLFLGLEIREPGCHFWSARSEALAGIQLARGMYRYLPTLVAMRGFRVAEVPARQLRLPHQLPDAWPNLGDLLCVWWLSRRWQNYAVQELTSPPAENIELHTFDDYVAAPLGSQAAVPTKNKMSA